MKREPGYYRIEYNGVWRIAEWTPIEYWYLTGVGHGIRPDNKFITSIDNERLSAVPGSAVPLSERDES